MPNHRITTRLVLIVALTIIVVATTLPSHSQDQEESNQKSTV